MIRMQPRTTTRVLLCRSTIRHSFRTPMHLLDYLAQVDIHFRCLHPQGRRTRNSPIPHVIGPSDSVLAERCSSPSDILGRTASARIHTRLEFDARFTRSIRRRRQVLVYWAIYRDTRSSTATGIKNPEDSRSSLMPTYTLLSCRHSSSNNPSGTVISRPRLDAGATCLVESAYKIPPSSS